MRVTKDFTFEAAHRLSDYEGKCKRVHGHNYKVVVTVEGEVDNRGILVDFGDLKAVAKSELLEVFDHRLLLKDTIENRHMFREFADDWLVWVLYNPTAENMASDFLERIKVKLPQVVEVTVYETADSYATAKVS